MDFQNSTFECVGVNVFGHIYHFLHQFLVRNRVETPLTVARISAELSCSETNAMETQALAFRALAPFVGGFLVYPLFNSFLFLWRLHDLLFGPQKDFVEIF